MSKRTSGDLSNVLEVAKRNDLADGCDDTEVSEGSKEPDSKESAAVVGGGDFMHTDDFRRLFVGFAMVDTLVAMRWLDRKWHKVVEKKLTEFEDEPQGEIIVHGGNDLSVGDRACLDASILVIVDIPEGITIIGECSFYRCSSLKEMKFPKSLTSIGDNSFGFCSSLEQVDLLHTSVQVLGLEAFSLCTSLREMKVPDSLQTLGGDVFYDCSKLVPSNIDVSDPNNDLTSEVVAYLRSIQ
ncbi:hypothetical protein TrST_g11925 [Triparma strigata]|uniref:Uncharacterized protein n=1 Tax=Triparma strigata TaxID=1606541 RepID=A0A9W7BP76_9STRA|nr:hypothetical protein TrST_g11925 [Triparma strigata]